MARIGHKSIATGKAPQPAASYSQGVEAGHFIFVAGQGPIMPDGTIRRGSIAEQTRLTLDNIKAILEAGGASMNHVVRVSAHLSELNKANFQEYNAVYQEYFQDPLPVRITVGSQLLDIDVEIEVIAHVE